MQAEALLSTSLCHSLQLVDFLFTFFENLLALLLNRVEAKTKKPKGLPCQ